MFIVIYYDGNTPRSYGNYKTEAAAKKEAQRVIRTYGKVSVGKVEIISTGEQMVKWEP